MPVNAEINRSASFATMPRRRHSGQTSTQLESASQQSRSLFRESMAGPGNTYHGERSRKNLAGPVSDMVKLVAATFELPGTSTQALLDGFSPASKLLT